MNPIYKEMSKSDTQLPNGIKTMMESFDQFRRSFSGDPKQVVESLMKTGRMTQEQFNRFAQMATELSKYFHC